MLLSIALYLLFGAFSGLVAGLFGVGGGAVIVPILIYAFSAQAFPPEFSTHMAIGTSLAIISFTSLSSVRTHHNNGFVLWPYVRIMAPALLVGVAIGVYTVVQIPGPVLQWIIGSFLCLVAVQMAFNLMPEGQEKKPSALALAGAGSGIGWVSALFGIGGGTLTVPFLSFYGTRMQYAVATSAACGFPIAVGGALTNIIVGWDIPDLPKGSFGFVHLPAFFGIVIMSMPFAHLGANLAKRLSAVLLKRFFATFLVLVGLSIIATASGAN